MFKITVEAATYPELLKKLSYFKAPEPVISRDDTLPLPFGDAPAPPVKEAKVPAPPAEDAKAPAPPAEDAKAPAPPAEDAKAPAPPAEDAKVPTPPAEDVKVPTPPVEDAEEVELDSLGMPWDERIHASTKTKTVDGVWKKKRGVHTALVEQVKAEHAGTGKSYTDLVMLVSQLVTDDPDTGSEIQDVIIEAGYGKLPELSTETPEKLAEIYEKLEELLDVNV